MFDPSIGRWLEEDPILFTAGDANLNRFVGNNPTNLTDPTGLQAKPLQAEKVWYRFNPADFTTTPSIRKGKVEVAAGFFSWDIRVGHTEDSKITAKFRFELKDSCKSEAISFIQVVHEFKKGGRPYFPPSTKRDYFKQFSTDPEVGNFLDHHEHEDDPYMGAKWDKKGVWTYEGPGHEVGRRSTGKPAYTVDTPGFKDGKRQAISLSATYETAAFAIDSQEVLAVVKWGFAIPKDNTAPITLSGGDRDSVDAVASNEFRALAVKANQVAAMKHKLGRPDRSKVNSGGSSAVPLDN